MKLGRKRTREKFVACVQAIAIALRCCTLAECDNGSFELVSTTKLCKKFITIEYWYVEALNAVTCGACIITSGFLRVEGWVSCCAGTAKRAD